MVAMEDQSATEREKKKGIRLCFFYNTLIKSCFDTVNLTRTLQNTVMTILSFLSLSLKLFFLMHLENPVEHGDIDTNYDYLSKTKQSLENLQQLYQTKQLFKFVKLLSLYDFLIKTKIQWHSSGFQNIFK
jgi:hypothetical protein